MAHSSTVCSLDVHQLAAIVGNRIDNALILDSRSFLEYNASHVVNAVNVGCAKLMKRRLQQEKLSVEDFLALNCHWEVDRSTDVIVYDQSTRDARYLSPDSFVAVFLQKLLPVYNSVSILKGGFVEFQASYPHLCEEEGRSLPSSLSQPCLPVSRQGPTRVLPFLFLGSQADALDREALQHHNITYQLNVSASCPKPDFIQESHFMRIPVLDNYTEKLLPHFPSAFRFLEKVRESGGCVLVHCLAGISRSATVAISYVMRSLRMTSDEAYRYVKAKRPTISPNFNFLGQLLEYEKQLQRELVLGPKSETSSTPIFGTSSLSYERSCSTETGRYSQRLVPDSYCVKYAEIAVGSSTHFESSKTTECLVACEQKLDARTGALDIECLPVSSLRELSFTPCQTSTYKSTVNAEKSLTKCLSRSGATSTTYGTKCPSQDVATSQTYGTKCLSQNVATSPTYGTKCLSQNVATSMTYGTKCLTSMTYGTKCLTSMTYGTKCLSQNVATSPTYGTKCLSQNVATSMTYGTNCLSENVVTSMTYGTKCLTCMTYDTKCVSQNGATSPTYGTKCLSQNVATSPTGSKGGGKRSYLTEIRMNVSQDLTSPADLKAFEFDSKSYNRSDSVSTSGLGSEGSDYADSWNEYTSSCERETDILMDDDYPVVPTGEDVHGSKRMGSFEDSYEDSLSLYPKYESTYNPCRTQYAAARGYLQIDSEANANKPAWNHEHRTTVTVEDLGRAQLLHRAQSCPGMLGSEPAKTDDGVKLRRSKLARSSRDGSCGKNRYSCSSIDYVDGASSSRDSCPDASDGSKKYCSYRHSMIQVS